VNLFERPPGFPSPDETVDVLAEGPEVRVERILSAGHVTPEGQWYDQDRDEWVALIEGRARLVFDDGTDLELGPGDAVFLAAHRRHRVAWTSAEPPCVWLAVHADLGGAGG
jgi:cupin 2 domain-containing protein